MKFILDAFLLHSRSFFLSRSLICFGERLPTGEMGRSDDSGAKSERTTTQGKFEELGVLRHMNSWLLAMCTKIKTNLKFSEEIDKGSEGPPLWHTFPPGKKEDPENWRRIVCRKSIINYTARNKKGQYDRYWTLLAVFGCCYCFSFQLLRLKIEKFPKGPLVLFQFFRQKIKKIAFQDNITQFIVFSVVCRN